MAIPSKVKLRMLIPNSIWKDRLELAEHFEEKWVNSVQYIDQKIKFLVYKSGGLIMRFRIIEFSTRKLYGLLEFKGRVGKFETHWAQKGYFTLKDIRSIMRNIPWDEPELELPKY